MTHSELIVPFSGGTSGGTWIVNFRVIAAACDEATLQHLIEMASLGASWRYWAIS
jgi:hypothetical protein